MQAELDTVKQAIADLGKATDALQAARQAAHAAIDASVAAAGQQVASIATNKQ